jgi:plasmid stability protein
MSGKEDRRVVPVGLHPDIEAFLEGLVARNGRSIAAEIVEILGNAMEAAELPPAPTNAPFVCRETLMAEKAECKECGELIRHHASTWARRHVQVTGHNVVVSLHYDMIEDDWTSKLTPERRAEIEAIQDGEVARAFAQGLLRSRH